MSATWRVQRYTGEKLVRDWRWLWLRMKSVSQWQTFAVSELEVSKVLNGPGGISFKTFDPWALLAFTPRGSTGPVPTAPPSWFNGVTGVSHPPEPSRGVFNDMEPDDLSDHPDHPDNA